MPAQSSRIPCDWSRLLAWKEDETCIVPELNRFDVSGLTFPGTHSEGSLSSSQLISAPSRIAAPVR
jgi:hypothetical protein